MPAQTYQEKIDGNRRRGVEQSLLGRDVFPGYPPPGDLALRASCARNLRLFCESYFPNAFNLAWSDDHLKVIAQMQQAILSGGLFATAMPRGSGKTTLTVRACVWSLLYGHRRFICLIAATEKLATALLDQIKTELTYNARLAADFRQVCYPLQRLENNARKAIGQLFDGAQTRIAWSDDRLTLPTVPPSACDGPDVSGSTVTVAGLTGALRGQSHTLPDGRVLRPELVILDDPQTRESAASPKQSADRAAIVAGDVLGMAGPGRQIAAIMPCTVITCDDMAARMLDRKRHPEWHGIRTKMVLQFPSNERWWEEYNRLRAESMQNDGDGSEATEFYAANRDVADAGAVVSWPDRKYPHELSGLQHAMNLRFELKDAAFFAEYQNEPLPPDSARGEELTAPQIAGKLDRLDRGVVPVGCNRLTAMIDVQKTLLYYAVCAWHDDFTGYVVDYGSFPDQKRPYFSLRDAKRTLATLGTGIGVEGRIFAGLEALTSSLLGRTWPRDDGADMKIEKALVDAGAYTDTVLQFCRQSPHAAVLMPSHGHYVGPNNKPFREYQRRPGDRPGHHWRVPGASARGVVRHVLMDTNYWKSFLHARFAVAMGDHGCLSLWGDKPEAHRMFADHLTAEVCSPNVDVKSGRKLDLWKLRPERPDNHLFDAMVGCAVAASMLGCALPESAGAARAKPRRTSFAELQARARA